MTLEQGVNVYAMGSNGSGQLGIGHTEDVSKPEPVLGSTDFKASGITSIACGGNHSVFLSDEQHLASAGDNSDGRCFSIQQEQAHELVPSASAHHTVGQDGRKVKLIAATWSATIAVDHQDKVWVCGSGSSGELGLGASTSLARKPTQVPDFPPANTSITKLAACMGHVVAVLSNGQVWGWGKARKGQLGEPPENVWTPRKIEGVPFLVVDVVCAKDFTCVFGHPSTGQLLMLGPTGSDRFGIRESCPDSVPNWKQVGATWGSVLVLSESGKLSGWGRDDHGQLPPADLPLVDAFAAGSEHCLGVTRAGKVLAWGWGEHGNCGLPTDVNGDVKGRWNEVGAFGSLVSVFAGCATSFVVAKALPEISDHRIDMHKS